MNDTFSLDMSLMLKEELMRKALEEASLGAGEGEIPAGALVTMPDGKIISEAHNRTIGLSDPTAHAEILAIREAANVLANYRLTGLVVISTLEPCPMCLMAMLHARIYGLIYGADEPKWGAVKSLFALNELPGLNHHLRHLEGGILKEASQKLITDFFKARR
ncbi:MAG: nucleoside deaminase [Deltaproteobacteria bacterium]|jgi:tRNA(adenine34) deaminase|nr:nucleoside deaminase [Deltaproteobacteria bacterium]